MKHVYDCHGKTYDEVDDELENWFFQQKIVTDNGCWEWTRGMNSGYGSIFVKNQRMSLMANIWDRKKIIEKDIILKKAKSLKLKLKNKEPL